MEIQLLPYFIKPISANFNILNRARKVRGTTFIHFYSPFLNNFVILVILHIRLSLSHTHTHTHTLLHESNNNSVGLLRNVSRQAKIFSSWFGKNQLPSLLICPHAVFSSFCNQGFCVFPCMAGEKTTAGVCLF